LYSYSMIRLLCQSAVIILFWPADLSRTVGIWKAKRVDVGLIVCFFHRVLTYIVEVAFTQEFTWKSTEDDDFFISNLGNSSTLSLWELYRWHINDCPVLRAVLRVITFNRVAVLATWLSNTTEDIYESVLERATWMVVSTNIEVWNFEPEIKIDVVLFTSFVGSIIFTSRASDN
jgi:hypothetical protein